MITKTLVDRIKAISGYCFDPRFFCYCEDADLIIRAVLLGYRPLYLNQLLALHEGQVSSGGGYNSFIAYHGLRNTIWMHVKLMPAGLLWRHGLLLVLAHGLMIGRHIISGRFVLMLRVYCDALRGLPEFIAERRRYQKNPHAYMLESYITKCFYRKGYLQSILRENRFLKRFFNSKPGSF